jgi:hypothetical protein
MHLRDLLERSTGAVSRRPGRELADQHAGHELGDECLPRPGPRGGVAGKTLVFQRQEYIPEGK